MLAATAYVALVAAAIGTRNAILSEVVWAVPLLAICYAVVVAAIHPGRRRAMAVGFVALAAIYLACVYFAPTKTPARLPTSPNAHCVAPDSNDPTYFRSGAKC
jgi:hypothetical protein